MEYYDIGADFPFNFNLVQSLDSHSSPAQLYQAINVGCPVWSRG